MKRINLITAATCFAVLCAFTFFYQLRWGNSFTGPLKVGFIYENDGTAPYSYNFALAETALEDKYGEKVEILSKSNVLEAEAEIPICELAHQGCRIIFTNSHSGDFYEMASAYPEIQFCQVSWGGEKTEDLPDNYHTFNGEIYQGRYVSGIAAGMKLRELIDKGVITPEEAVVGYVGSYSSSYVISGYTAFLLGVRSVAPEAVMRVRYTHSWSNFILEKDCARSLIEEGCVLLSHHTGTIGPAAACEEAAEGRGRRIYFIGYNESMIYDAPTCAITSTGIDWRPYIVGAVGALLDNSAIEKTVPGSVHGQDMSAGFDRGWVRMFELNTRVAAPGTREAMDEAAKALAKGRLKVFEGSYTGTDPDDPDDRIDLSSGYTENARSSSPDFHYVLDGVITVEN